MDFQFYKKKKKTAQTTQTAWTARVPRFYRFKSGFTVFYPVSMRIDFKVCSDRMQVRSGFHNLGINLLTYTHQQVLPNSLFGWGDLVERELRAREREEKLATSLVWLMKEIAERERIWRDPRKFCFFAQVRRKTDDTCS
jgi:hypothetical protein